MKNDSTKPFVIYRLIFNVLLKAEMQKLEEDRMCPVVNISIFSRTSWTSADCSPMADGYVFFDL